MTDPSAQTMLEQFANEAERGEHGTMLINIAKAIRSIALRVVPAEMREATIEECAKLCDEIRDEFTNQGHYISEDAADDCAIAVRALAVTRPHHPAPEKSNG